MGTNPEEENEWKYISEFQLLSESFIEENADKVDWGYISACQVISEDFMERHSDKIYWVRISIRQKLSEGFIERHSDKVDWERISERQILSEEFIERHNDKVNWDNISTYQVLSEEFIERHNDKVDWGRITKYQILSKDFIKTHNLSIPETCWIYKTGKFLKGEVKAMNLYECHEEYFIAYKLIRRDRYSKFNFQYQYFKDGTYESNCDCNIDEANSFGLSIWTEDEARNYCDELVIKVKIRYEDVGAIVHSGGRIRCRRLTVLS